MSQTPAASTATRTTVKAMDFRASVRSAASHSLRFDAGCGRSRRAFGSLGFARAGAEFASAGVRVTAASGLAGGGDDAAKPPAVGAGAESCE